MSSISNDLQQIIKNIDTLIQKNGMNAREFAQKLGKRPGIVTDWRTGRAAPSIDVIIEMCKLFNCKLYDIFPSYLFGDETHDADELNLLCYFRELPDYDKEEILLLAGMKYRRAKEREKSSRSQTEQMA